MKNYFFRQSEINSNSRSIKRYFEYSLLFLVGTMPFHTKANSASIVILAVVWLCEGNMSSKWKMFLDRPLIWFFILFYFSFLLGMLNTDNIEIGKFNLEKKISLLALPLLIGTSSSYDQSMKKRVLAFFVLICLAASLICLGNGFYHFLIEDNTMYLFHEELTSVIEFHPPYFGMYLSLAIIICLFYLKSNWLNLKVLQRLSIAMLVVYFLFFVLLLSARTSALFLTLFFCSVFFYLVIKKRMMKEGLFGVIIFFIIIIITMSQSSYLADRVIKPFTSDISAIDGGRETGLSIRIVKWRCSILGIVEYPILGVGTGDAVDYLVSCYEKKNFWGMYPQYRFNSHNQFLETGLTLGILGLSMLILCMGLPIVYSFRSRDYLLLGFIMLFAFCSLTESLLERQWGIVFFAFFTSVFCFVKNDSEIILRADKKINKFTKD